MYIPGPRGTMLPGIMQERALRSASQYFLDCRSQDQERKGEILSMLPGTSSLI